MKKLLIVAIAALALVGCEKTIDSEKLSVAGNTYEKKYEDDGKIDTWEIIFTTDSLHSYWKGDLEVSASYIQSGSKVSCLSTKGIEFTIIAHEDYIIYSDNTFMKKQ